MHVHDRPDGLCATPLKSIRRKCLECSCGKASEVARCELVQCWLWPWRFGKHLDRPKRQLTEKRKEQLRSSLKQAREARRP